MKEGMMGEMRNVLKEYFGWFSKTRERKHDGKVARLQEMRFRY